MDIVGIPIPLPQWTWQAGWPWAAGRFLILWPELGRLPAFLVAADDRVTVRPSDSRAETANARMESVIIGGVEVPANFALARKEHPRLLFTQADLPRLRARLKQPPIAAELEHAKQLAAEKKAGAILLGVLYYLTEQREYIDQARAKLEPSWVQAYPLAADLVMGAMTPAEQQAEADRIVGIIKKERWRPHLVLDLAAWATATTSSWLPTCKRDIAAIWLRALNTTTSGRKAGAAVRYRTAITASISTASGLPWPWRGATQPARTG